MLGNIDAMQLAVDDASRADRITVDHLVATIRESHPEWTQQAVAEAVSERMLRARI